ncbi:hypothetical protein HN873_036397, partial [Arachis hypogaea]
MLMCYCSLGGALKPTDIDTLWVHVTCAWFRPEVAFASDEKMEPALGILSIPSSSFVKQIHGSCTQCCKSSTYFHAMCASRAGYRMEVGSTLGSQSRHSFDYANPPWDYEEFGHDGNRTVANGVDKEGPVLSYQTSFSCFLVLFKWPVIQILPFVVYCFLFQESFKVQRL